MAWASEEAKWKSIWGWCSPSLPWKTKFCHLGETICNAEPNQSKNRSTTSRLCTLQLFTACYNLLRGFVTVLTSAGATLQQMTVLYWQRGWLMAQGAGLPWHMAMISSRVVHSPISVCAPSTDAVGDHSIDKRGWSVNQWMVLSPCVSCYGLFALFFGDFSVFN